jgi:hypothetical protein
MKIPEMIAVLEAAERGEQIEYRSYGSSFSDPWGKCLGSPKWDFSHLEYRIAPKKEVTLVEELRKIYELGGKGICTRAADRIEELEKCILFPVQVSTDKLLAELKKRVK